VINFLIALGVYVFLFILLFVSIKVGYRYGIWRKVQVEQNQFGIVKVAEGTIFAIFGLLVAFSFSGAYQRFEDRKIKIIEEINAIEVAYLRTDLLEVTSQASMKALLREYVDARIETYERLAEFHGFWKELALFRELENKVWVQAVAAVKKTNTNSASLLFIPAINARYC